MHLRRTHSLSVALALVLAACTTSAQVREAVASSNAALIEPYLPLPARSESKAWQASVAELDALIAQNADQPTLVAHLRVRQALLLTVARQDELAHEVWNAVERDRLATERDQRLWEARDALVWWYWRAPRAGVLDREERERASSAREALFTSASAAGEEDLRLYLGTLAAQMALELQRGVDASTPEGAAAARTGLATDLARYVALFSEADRAWVREHPQADLADGIGIAVLRHRFWLRALIESFRAAAAEQELDPPPAWEPGWIAEL